MKRRLFAILSALSLLLFVAVCVLWVRSYWICDTTAWYWERVEASELRLDALGITSDSSGLAFFQLRRWTTLPRHIRDSVDWQAPFQGVNHVSHSPAGYPYMHEAYQGSGWLGFGLFEGPRSSPILLSSPAIPPLSDADRFIVIPLSSMAFVTVVLPVLMLCGRFHRRLRPTQSCCPSCGYDLRATPERCPECGAAPAKTTA